MTNDTFIQIFLAVEVFLPLFCNHKSALFMYKYSFAFFLLIGWDSKLCFQ